MDFAFQETGGNRIARMARRILAARKAKVDAGEEHFLSIDELKERLRR